MLPKQKKPCTSTYAYDFRIPVRSSSPGAVPKNKKEKETLVSGVPKQKKSNITLPP